MIPKVIHQIWINFDQKTPKPIPEKYLPWMDSWKERHPDWVYMLWGDREIESLILENYQEYWQLYNSCKYPVQKTDIARIIIVHYYGGLYTDTDTECRQNLDKFTNSDKGMVTVRSFMGILSNHFFMSEKNNPILLDCLERVKKNIDAKVYPDWLYIFYSTGPLIIHTACQKKSIDIIEASEFPDYLLMKLFKGDFIAIHHSQGSWMNPKFIEIFHVIVEKLINKITDSSLF